MALTITPGFDFGVKDTPTSLLFRRAGENLRISGIPFERIEGDTVAIVFGDTTGVSGGQPTATGWIWVDSAGNRILQITDDTVPGDNPLVDSRVWKATGGWETSRLLLRGNSGAQEAIADGQHLWLGADFRLDETRLDMDLNHTPRGLTQIFQTTSATNGRVNGRGLCVAATDAQVTETLLRTHRPGILTDAAGQFTWRVLDQFGGHKAHFAGTVMGRSHGSTGDTLSGVENSVWYVDRNLGKS